jgi:hypothetical protein
MLTQPKKEVSTWERENHQQRVLKLSDTGKKRIELLCERFVEYIKQNHRQALSYFINIFDVSRLDPPEPVGKVFFHVKDEKYSQKLEDAFRAYLKSIGDI